ncbi:MAG: hypothetical protein U0893_24060 [Chloroflexota bacterium]
MRQPRIRREPTFWLGRPCRPRDGGWALPCSASRELLGWAWQRWEIEVCHREPQGRFGLGEPQCWNPTATETVTAWQAWAYAVLVLAGIRAQPWRGTAPSARTLVARARWSFGTLWRGYRQALALRRFFPTLPVNH